MAGRPQATPGPRRAAWAPPRPATVGDAVPGRLVPRDHGLVHLAGPRRRARSRRFDARQGAHPRDPDGDWGAAAGHRVRATARGRQAGPRHRGSARPTAWVVAARLRTMTL